MAQRKKVLVIDDDTVSSSLIEQTLGSYGCEVIVVDDARSGYETAKDQLPDLIFINLLLPEINGLKVSKAIHSVEALKAVPIIMILGRTGEVDPRYTATIGIVDVLVKPFSSDEITEKVRTSLGEDALVSGTEGGTGTHFGDEEIEPVIVIDDEEAADDALVATEDDFKILSTIQEDDRDHLSAPQEKRDTERPEMTYRFKPEDDAGERDLFSALPDSPGGEAKSSEDEREPGVSGISDLSADDYELAADEMSVSPIRRGLMIAASIAAGIALGIGGYLFFTAGDKQQLPQKQVTKVLPAPAAVTPSAPAAPAVKPGSIREIPIKQEPDESGTAKQEQAKSEKPAVPPEKVPAKAAEAQKQAAKKAESKPAVADGLYYVQAGIFGNKDNAAALAAKIRNAGFEASVKNVEGGDKKTLYRVVAGSPSSHKKAVEMSESLNRKGIKTIVHRQ